MLPFPQMQDNKMIQMMELQQLLSLPLLQPHPFEEPNELLLPHPQNKRRMMIQHMLLPPFPPNKPHPLLHLSLHLSLHLFSLHPQFDKSPIKASIEFDYSIWYGGSMAMFL